MSDANILLPALAVLGLICMSAFFSGSETGLTSVAREKIHALKMEGNRRAETLGRIREDTEGLIGAILLGNNVVNIAASAIATAIAIELFGQSGVVFATAAMTVLVLVFAEVLPKTYAVRHAESVALAVAPAFVIITKIFAPFTRAVQFVVNLVIDLFSPEPPSSMSGADALRGAINMYHEEGEVAPEDKFMLSGIIDLDVTDVRDIMIHRGDMFSINADAPVKEIAKQIADSCHTRIPVWKGDANNFIGVLHTKDLFRALQNHEGDLDTLVLSELMRPVLFVPGTTTLKNQLAAFRRQRSHFALVVDDFGGVAGLVTLEDILEEVVGEIEDEHDIPETDRIKANKDGSIDVDGDLPLREINKFRNWQLPDQDSKTIAGLVMHAVQCVPEADSIHSIGKYMVRVLNRTDSQILRLKVRETGEQKTGSKRQDETSLEPDEKEVEQ